ncbi:MoxR family ATPase [Frankia sp. AiPs1]|uniref:AAA family ATPase n=1 Tax=Frankia sp. AiPa1 TaxID=573492 RepID=UPI00202B4E26|nr:AAA family ATPase [Frankia sp. AiPa1]MCL9759212.1 AAA family ATPase [Frankia sp. AiPa1]
MDDILRRIDRMQDAPRPDDAMELPMGDRRDGLVYRHDEDLRTVVKIAIATGRPLLLLGESGAGKSAFAPYVARNLGWRYYEHVMTRRTEARDLLWTFDAVRKLADAQNRSSEELRDADYIEPGVLWWALDRASAVRRGLADGEPHVSPAEPHGAYNDGRAGQGAVLLADEIGKASADVLDALLVPFGSLTFQVSETNARIGPPKNRGQLLIVLASNDDLPPSDAFRRRCVVHTLRVPEHVSDYVDIARRHLVGPEGELDGDLHQLCVQLAQEVHRRREEMGDSGRSGRKPSTAEYLDAVVACKQLGIKVDSPEWQVMRRAVLSIPQDDPGGEAR